MDDDLHWVSITAHQPQNNEVVYARVKYGVPRKVTFYARPTPRWEGANIVYDFLYFAEWAPLESKQATKKSA